MRARIRWEATVGLALILLLGGCGGDGGGTAPPDPVDPTIVATVSVSPGQHTFESIGDTLRFSAEARNAAGAALTATITWSSSASGVIEVDATGLATAVSNGTATIVATPEDVEDVEDEADGTVAQVPVSLAVTGDGLPAGAAGLPLDSLIEFRVADANDHSVEGLEVVFAPTDGGSVDPATATTDGEGLVTTVWTLGPVAGPQALEATLSEDESLNATLTGNAFASTPATVSLVDGDQQSELTGLALPAPIRVLVVDEHGNPAADVAVLFSASDGGGIEPAEVFTDLDGIAAGVWTLGPGAGAQSVEARVTIEDASDSIAVELEGSPLAFTAEGVSLEVSAVSPDTVTAGSTLTLTGTGFAAEPADNQVELGGLPATILEATQTELLIQVPPSGCEAIGQKDLVVNRAGRSAGASAVVHPVERLTLEVGEYTILEDPSDFCIQFPGSESAGHEYLVGLTGSRALAAFSGFRIVGDDGQTPVPVSPAPVAAAPLTAVATDAGAASSSSELALREWERAFVSTRPRLARHVDARPSPGVASDEPMAVPGMGQLMTFRVPDISVDPCNSYTATSTRVVAVGEGLVIAIDSDLPGAVETALADELAAFNQLFSESILDRALAYFGASLDLDENDRTIVVFTRAFNTASVPGFSSAVDLVERDVCPASDGGEIIYVAIPDDLTEPSLTAVMEAAGPTTAHQLVHVIQSSRRMEAGLSALPVWVSEGAAEVAEEVIGMKLRNEQLGMDYGAEEIDTDLGWWWYEKRFEALAALFGFDPPTGRFEGAPERCSLFGYPGLNIPCADLHARGAAWSFLRYVGDRIRVGEPDGEAAFHGALLMTPVADLMELLETWTATPFPSLVAEWAMTLYVDNRLPVGGGALEISSWDLVDVFGARHTNSGLVPEELGFASFTRSGTIIGGGTRYLRIAAGGAHEPLTLRARNGEDQPLGGELAPRLWVVRLQ